MFFKRKPVKVTRIQPAGHGSTLTHVEYGAERLTGMELLLQQRKCTLEELIENSTKELADVNKVIDAVHAAQGVLGVTPFISGDTCVRAASLPRVQEFGTINTDTLQGQLS